MRGHQIIFWIYLAAFWSGDSAAQEAGYEISLHVVHNGQAAAPPPQVIFKSGGSSAALPVEHSKFLVPKQLAAAPTFTFQAEIGGDTVTVTDIRTEALEESSWTIVLADRRFPEKYRRVIPRATSPRSVCVIVFEPRDAESTLLGVSDCRKPTQKPKAGGTVFRRVALALLSPLLLPR